MGFFSWKTADTKRSIYNKYTKSCKPVYLLQPNGKPPIFEPEYEGYGQFGGIQAYYWLGLHNLPEELIGKLSNEEIGAFGIDLECGCLCKDTTTGELWKIFHRSMPLDVDCKFFPGTYLTPIPEYDGKSANELMEEKRFERVPFSNLFKVRYPLKFSFNANAIYEDLPASENCPHQGYFGREAD